VADASSNEPVGRFVGVGVSRYSGGLIELPKATTDVTSLAGLLAAAFEGAPLLDPARADVQTLLEGLPQSVAKGQVLVAVWSGHGQPSANGTLRLQTSDTIDVDLGGVTPGDVMTACALSGASQILLVLDTCYAGKASPVMAEIADRIMRGVHAPSAENRKVGGSTPPLATPHEQANGP
jgi:hypothetical protein